MVALIHGTLRPDAIQEGQPRTFRTARIPDPNLVEALQEHGVTFSGQYTSPFLKALLSWVVPILIFVGIWFFLSRRLQTGNGLMALGKSRAKV